MNQMREDKNASEDRRFLLQVVAFCLIVVPSLLLYVAVTDGPDWATWMLMALIAGGMVLGMWIS